MTDVAIDRCAEGGTSQCGPQVARARAERGGGCLVVVAPVRNVAPAGLSIHRRGPVDRPTGAGCRDGDGSDVQAAAQPSGRSPSAGGGRRNNGLVSCRKCGYALSRTSARTSARKIHYYRCLGSDAWRHLGGPVCDSRPIRQDLLDQIVWQEVIHLIEDPTLIRAELDRRLDAARAAE